MDKVKIAIIAAVVIIAAVIVINWEVVKSYFLVMKLKGQQKEFIKNLNPQVKGLFSMFIHRVNKETPYEVYITSGYRSYAKQAQLHAQNPSNAPAGGSMHNFGLAIDINGVKDGVFTLKKATPKQEWLDSGIPQIAAEMGLTWGGNFQSYYDPIHFGFDGIIPIASLRQLAEQTYGTNPNEVEANQLNLISLV